MPRACPVLVAALATLGGAPGAAAAEELDRVVAVVRSRAAEEPHVLTLSRVEEETRIAVVARGGALAATQPLDAAALRAGLDWLVDQLLLAEEAARLRVFDVDAAGSRAELERFRTRFASAGAYRAFLARLDVTEAELEAVLRRTLRVSRYVESRVSLAAQVPERDVTVWLERRGGGAEAADRDAARARLVEERVRAETEVLLRDLRARAEVRILAPPAGRS